MTAAGIRARVVRDTVTEDGAPLEDTRDLYAQDRAGTVWYLGERTAEYRDGRVVSTEGSWEAGVDGAQAGVVMPGHPRPGQRYRQEYYAGHAEDRGSVVAVGEQADAPAGHFGHVLMTREVNALEPRALEFKFYARGVGQVLAVEVSGGTGREELRPHGQRCAEGGGVRVLIVEDEVKLAGIVRRGLRAAGHAADVAAAARTRCGWPARPATPRSCST